jgi:multicomponent Na+:H+ antiporter subunit D
MLLAPVLFTATLALLAGVLAGSELSPLAWSQLIINRRFGL